MNFIRLPETKIDGNLFYFLRTKKKKRNEHVLLYLVINLILLNC